MAEKFMPFGAWRPDSAQVSEEGVSRAENVIRTKEGYRPFPGLAAFSADALPTGTPVGLFFGKDTANNATQFAAIYDAVEDRGWYQLDTTLGTWTRIGAVDIASDQRFRHVQYDDTLYITNFDDGLRKWQLGVDSDFTAVSSALGAIAPKYLAVIRDFLVGGFMDVPAGSVVPNRVQWSAIADAADWDEDADTLAGHQDIPDAGEVRGVVSGEFGTVLMEDGIFRMDFVGSPAVFSFNRIENARGCIEPNSVVAAGGFVYYLSDDGWKAFDGQRVVPIGSERFDRWWNSNAVKSNLSTMSSFVDPEEQLLAFGFDAGFNNVDVNDTVLVYNYAINEPTMARVDHSILGPFLTGGVTVEGLNTFVLSDLTDYEGVWDAGTTYALDDVVAHGGSAWKSLQNSNTGNTPAEDAWWTADARTASIDDLESSTDSAVYKSGGLNFGAIKENVLNTFTGTPDTAVIETTSMRLGNLRRSTVDRAHLFVEGTGHAATIEPGVRDALDVPASFGTARSRVGDSFPMRSEGMYHRMRVNISGNWNHALGVMVEHKPTSKR
jgi:hypothetical protein